MWGAGVWSMELCNPGRATYRRGGTAMGGLTECSGDKTASLRARECLESVGSDKTASRQAASVWNRWVVKKLPLGRPASVYNRSGSDKISSRETRECL